MIQDVETVHPRCNEVLIRNHAIAIQPLDANMLISVYGPTASLIYPAAPGSSGAGITEEVDKDVADLKVGGRVIFDTKAYVDPQATFAQGTRQELVRIQLQKYFTQPVNAVVSDQASADTQIRAHELRLRALSNDYQIGATSFELVSDSISTVSYTKVDGGLVALQKACQYVFDGKVRGKLVIDPQE